MRSIAMGGTVRADARRSSMPLLVEVSRYKGSWRAVSRDYEIAGGGPTKAAAMEDLATALRTHRRWDNAHGGARFDRIQESKPRRSALSRLAGRLLRGRFVPTDEKLYLELET